MHTDPEFQAGRSIPYQHHFRISCAGHSQYYTLFSFNLPTLADRLAGFVSGEFFIAVEVELFEDGAEA